MPTQDGSWPTPDPPQLGPDVGIHSPPGSAGASTPRGLCWSSSRVARRGAPRTAHLRRPRHVDRAFPAYAQTLRVPIRLLSDDDLDRWTRRCPRAAGGRLQHMTAISRTGQTGCHGWHGQPGAPADSGQDAEYVPGLRSPRPRFARSRADLVEDRLTGLIWSRNANPADFPLTWQEALDFVARLNGDSWPGRYGLVLPNRRELRSLVSAQTRRPALPAALPADHPFTGVFPSWFGPRPPARTASHACMSTWTGARTFFAARISPSSRGPSAGERVLPVTGAVLCHSADGSLRDCPGTARTASSARAVFGRGRVW